jgi:hypothetical protein
VVRGGSEIARRTKASSELRLSGLLQTLDVRLQEAVANRLGHAEFVELICRDEIKVRH